MRVESILYMISTVGNYLFLNLQLNKIVQITFDQSKGVEKRLPVQLRYAKYLASQKIPVTSLTTRNILNIKINYQFI